MASDVLVVVRGDNQVSGVLRGVTRDLQGLKAEAGIVGKSLGLVGTGLKVAGVAAVGAIGAVGAGMTAMAVSGTKQAATFQAEVQALTAVLGGTDAQVGQLRQHALDLGLDPQLKVSATEALAAMTELAKQGATTDNITGGLTKSVIMLSNATGTDMVLSATVASDAMNLFGLRAEDMALAVAGITQVANQSKFDVQDYYYALAQGGPVAHQMGIDFEEFNAVITATASNFSSGRTSGTAFRNFFQGLVPTTKTAKSAMRELGLVTDEGNQFFDAQTGELKDLTEVVTILQKAYAGLSVEQQIAYSAAIFGQDAIGAVNALLGTNTQVIQENIDAQHDMSAMQEQAAIRSKGLVAALDLFGGVMEVINIQIGDLFLPNVEKLVRSITPLVERLAPAIVASFRPMAGVFEMATDGIIGFAERITEMITSGNDLYTINLADFISVSWDSSSGISAFNIDNLITGEIDFPERLVQVDINDVVKGYYNWKYGVGEVNINDVVFGLLDLRKGGISKLTWNDVFDFQVGPGGFTANIANQIQAGILPAFKTAFLNIGDDILVGINWKKQVASLDINQVVTGVLDLRKGGITKLTWKDVFNFANVDGNWSANIANQVQVGVSQGLKLAHININDIVFGQINWGKQLATLNFGQNSKLNLKWGEDIAITGNIADAFSGLISITAKNGIVVGLKGEDFTASLVAGVIRVTLGEKDFVIDAPKIAEKINTQVKTIADEVRAAYEKGGLQGVGIEVGGMILAGVTQMWDTVKIGVAVGGFLATQGARSLGGQIGEWVVGIQQEVLGYFAAPPMGMQMSGAGDGGEILAAVTAVIDGLTTVFAQVRTFADEVRTTYQTGGLEGVGVEVGGMILTSVTKMWDTVKLGLTLGGFMAAQGLASLTQSIQGLATSENGAAVAQGLNDFIAGLTTVFTQLQAIRLDVIQSVTSAIYGITTAVVDLASLSVGNIDTSKIATLLTGMADGIRSMSEIVFDKEELDTLGDSLGTVTTTIVEKLTELLSEPGFGKDIGTALGGATAAFVSGAKSFVEGFVDQIDDPAVWADFASSALNFVNDFTGGVTAALETADFSGLASAIVSGIARGVIAIGAGASAAMVEQDRANQDARLDWVNLRRAQQGLPAMESQAFDWKSTLDSISSLFGPGNAPKVEVTGSVTKLDTSQLPPEAKEVPVTVVGAGDSIWDQLWQGLFGPGDAATIEHLRKLRQGVEPLRMGLPYPTVGVENVIPAKIQVSGIDYSLMPGSGQGGEPVVYAKIQATAVTVPPDVAAGFRIPMSPDAFTGPWAPDTSGMTVDASAAASQIQAAASGLQNVQIKAPDFSWPPMPAWAWPTLPSWVWPAIPRPGWISDLVLPRPSWLGELLSWSPVVTIRQSGPVTEPGQFASGALVTAGGMAWVGEAGPELIDLPRGSRVYSASESRQMAASAGNVYVTINATVSNDIDMGRLSRQVADEILRRSM